MNVISKMMSRGVSIRATRSSRYSLTPSVDSFPVPSCACFSVDDLGQGEDDLGKAMLECDEES
jgi:hypothetical protein